MLRASISRLSSKYSPILSRITPGEYVKPSFDPNANDRPPYPHARKYDYRAARSQILVPGLLQWLITCIIIVGIAGTFLGYQRDEEMNPRQRRTYNFCVTALVIALTINLASSMRAYVQVLRWRLLAATSLTIEEFDLALSCASQTKTLKLCFLHAWKRGRVGWVQVLCLLWILVNLGMAIVTGLLGLTQELDPTAALVQRSGEVYVIDLTDIWAADSAAVGSGLPLADQNNNRYFSVHTYGLQGSQVYSSQVADDALNATMSVDSDLQCNNDYSSTINCIYEDDYDTFAAYRLSIRGIDDYSLTNKSDFVVSARASCQAYNAWKQEGDYFFYTDDSGKNQSLWVSDNWAPGVVTYISDWDVGYDSRTANILAVQVAQERTDSNEVLNISSSTVFNCTNTVSPIFNITSGKTANITFYDRVAWYIAGAIGWTGYDIHVPNKTIAGAAPVPTTRNYVLMEEDSYWSPLYQLQARDAVNDNYVDAGNDYSNEPGMEALIQQFSMYALAAMDDDGFKTTVASSVIPTASVRLNVNWRYAGAILAVIPGVQLLLLLAVALWANKAVVKDDSLLTTARLLMPILAHLEHETEDGKRYHGSLLSGREIATSHPQGDGCRVYYGFHGSPHEDGTMRAEVVSTREGIRRQHTRNFPDGVYH
jgi:hypothetical protein